MFNLPKEKMEEIARQLLALAAIAMPAQSGAIIALLKAAAELKELLTAIREQDPAAWDAIAADFNASLANFAASVEANRAAAALEDGVLRDAEGRVLPSAGVGGPLPGQPNAPLPGAGPAPRGSGGRG